MKYCIIGAGGTGGVLAALMTKAGKDVTAIARGAHLSAMQKNGLTLRQKDLPAEVIPVKAVTMEEYTDIADVFFVCVKYYSLSDVIPFIKSHAKPESVVIPILNVYGTGEELSQALPDTLVTDGCIYVAAEIENPGVVYMGGSIIRVVYGVRNAEDLCKELFLIERDLKESGVEAVFSDDIKRDTLQKYAYVSPMAAAGLFYDAKTELFQAAGEPRLLAEQLMREIDALAVAMGHPFLVDIVKTNFDILDSLAPDSSTSMQRDIWNGKPSEIDGLLFAPLRMAEKYHVEMPGYQMIADKFKEYR